MAGKAEKVKEAVNAAVEEVKHEVASAFVEVNLKLGAIDHSVHLPDGIIHFKDGVAKVEHAIADRLRDLGIID